MILIIFIVSLSAIYSQKQVYRAGLPDVPGLMGRDDRGELHGFPIELTQALADQAGIELVWVDGSWSELFEALKKGELDMLPGTMITPERSEYLDFLRNVYYIQWGELYIKKSNELKSTDDLKNRKIALTKLDNNSAGFLTYMKDFGIHVDGVEYQSFRDSFSAVKNDEVFAMVGPSGGLGNPFFTSLKPTGLIFNPSSLTLAFPQNKDKRLQLLLDGVLEGMKEDPQSEYYTLLQKHRVGEHDIQSRYQMPVWMRILILTIGATLLLTSSLVYLLRNRLKRKGAELAEKHLQLSRSLGYAKMGYWELDLSNNSLFWSPEMFQLFGLSPINEPINWERLENYFTPKSIHEIKAFLQSRQWDWEVIDREALMETTEGIEFWILWRGQRIKKEDSRDMFQGIALDITEKKKKDLEWIKKEEMLQHSQRMNSIGQLAGGIAHDFNNMLTGIMGYADILESDLNDQRLKSYAHEILSAGNRASQLTRQLLTYARKGNMIFRPFDINQCIESIYVIIQRTMKKGIKINLILKAGNPNILGDFAQLQNALMNILLNAQDAISHKGQISVTTENIQLSREDCNQSPFNITPGEFLRLRIEDNGCGIDYKIQDRIFDPFFTTKPQGKGNGLGLASVYGTVISHRGAIKMESTPGKGTLMMIDLPNT